MLTEQPVLGHSRLRGEVPLQDIGVVRNVITHRFGLLQLTDYRVKFTPYPLKYKHSGSVDEGGAISFDGMLAPLCIVMYHHRGYAFSIRECACARRRGLPQACRSS